MSKAIAAKIDSNHMPPPVVEAQNLLMLVFTSAHKLGERSNFNGTMQRAMVSGVPKVRCRLCRGSTWGNQRQIDQWERDRKLFDDAQTEAADRYLASHPGSDPPGEMFFENVRAKPVPQGDCKRCGGQGEHPGKSQEEVTCRPSGSSHHAPNRSAPDESAILQAAEASRIMMRVERENLQHWRCLHAYHGNVGEYAHGKYGNRLLAVMLMLPAGQEMVLRGLSRARRKTHQCEIDTSETEALAEAANSLMRAGQWSRASAIMYRVKPRNPGPPDELALSVHFALSELHAMSTRADERRAEFDGAAIDAYGLLVDASRTWDWCVRG